MKKRYIVIPIIVVILAGAAFLVWRSTHGSQNASVVLDEVAPADLTKEVIATGEIASEESTIIPAGANGRIASVLVDEGEQVSSGTVLVALEDDAVRLRERSALLALESAQRQVLRELVSLRASYADAEAAVEQAEADYGRTRELQENGSATREALRLAEEAVTSARRALDRAREQLNFREGRALDDPRDTSAPPDDAIVAESIEVRQAESNLEAVHSDLAETRITARRAGTITEVYVEVGDLVGSSTQIARLDQLSDLIVVSAIDEIDLGYLEIGQKARIESDSFIGTSLEGEITKIGQIIRRQGDMRVCDVEVSFTDTDGVARVGASCAIYITVREIKDAPSVPIESFFIEDGTKYIFVAEAQPELQADGQMSPYVLERREVVIGILGLGRAEVTGGVGLGELVVASGVRELIDGQTVLAADPRQAEEGIAEESAETSADDKPDTATRDPEAFGEGTGADD
jgi:HlyD family secretion protein